MTEAKSQYATESQDTVAGKRDGQVSIQLNEYDELLVNLEEVVNNLRDALRPVLREVLTDKASIADSAQKDKEWAPLARAMTLANGKLNYNIDVIRVILQRLEL